MDQPRPKTQSFGGAEEQHPEPDSLTTVESSEGRCVDSEGVDENDEDSVVPILKTQGPQPRRLSTYESSDGGMDLESDVIGGSARG